MTSFYCWLTLLVYDVFLMLFDPLCLWRLSTAVWYSWFVTSFYCWLTLFVYDVFLLLIDTLDLWPLSPADWHSWFLTSFYCWLTLLICDIILLLTDTLGLRRHSAAVWHSWLMTSFYCWLTLLVCWLFKSKLLTNLSRILLSRQLRSSSYSFDVCVSSSDRDFGRKLFFIGPKSPAVSPVTVAQTIHSDRLPVLPLKNYSPSLISWRYLDDTLLFLYLQFCV